MWKPVHFQNDFSDRSAFSDPGLLCTENGETAKSQNGPFLDTSPFTILPRTTIPTSMKR